MDTDTFHFYATHPQHFWEMRHPTVVYFERNALCDDTIGIYLRIQDDIIVDWSFSGQSSMVTMACSGLFGDIVIWCTISEVLQWDQETIQIKTGMQVSPRRQRAQALPLLATKNAIYTYQQRDTRDDFSDIMPQ